MHLVINNQWSYEEWLLINQWLSDAAFRHACSCAEGKCKNDTLRLLFIYSEISYWSHQTLYLCINLLFLLYAQLFLRVLSRCLSSLVEVAQHMRPCIPSRLLKDVFIPVAHVLWVWFIPLMSGVPAAFRHAVLQKFQSGFNRCFYFEASQKGNLPWLKFWTSGFMSQHRNSTFKCF